jgi:transcriptional regulator with XRE-family HTH domain
MNNDQVSARKPPNTKLQYERKLNGWSQEYVAEKVDTTAKNVSRWERGDNKPVPYYQEKLTQLFGKNAEELGFLSDIIQDGELNRNISSEKPGQHTESGLEEMNPGRRKATKLIAAATGSTLLPQLNLLNQDALERLLRALKKPSHVDEMTLTHLAEITKQYWQMFSATAGPTRYFLLDGLSGHLQTIVQFLEYSLPTYAHARLCILASETTQVIGEILFDVKDSSTAEFYYNIAVEAAKNAQSDVLQAVALARKSFIPIYDKDAPGALSLLQEAHQLTSLSTPDITRAWLSAVEAEAQANKGDTYACSKALERAEYFLDRVKPDETGYARPGESQYARFSKIVLLGYKGVCYARLHQPESAQKALRESIALMDDARLRNEGIRHKSITLVDLAMTFIQQREIEEAYRYTEQAIGRADCCSSSLH